MIFKTHFDKATGSQSYDELTLFQVLLAEKLLDGVLYENLLKKLPKLIGVPDEYYQALYVPLINNFVEHVQALPVVNGGSVCGLMNTGLARAYYSVERYIKMNPEHQNHLHTYILFSAALLRDLGRVGCGRKIMMCNEKGEFERGWNPFENSMLYQGEYYRIRHTTEDHPDLHRLLTPVLAQQLMPRNGFLWISESEVTLSLWFSLLGEGGEDLESYEKIFEVAQKVALEYFSGPDFLLPVELRQAKQMQAGENFFQWLKLKLATGELTLGQDDSMIHEVDKGLFLEVDELYDKYAKEGGESKATVAKQFEKMGVTSDPEGKKRERYNKTIKSKAATVTGRSGYLASPGTIKSAYASVQGRVKFRQGTLTNGLIISDPRVLSVIARKDASKVFLSPDRKETPIGLILRDFLLESGGTTQNKPHVDPGGT